jgi:TusA-related sulfurtransferase
MSQDITADAELNCIGIACPGPIGMTRGMIDKIGIDQVLKVDTDDPAAEEDILRWALRTGHLVLKYGKNGSVLTFYIRRMK